MARLVGINHVALEVGDVDEALAWYRRFFDFQLRGRAGSSMAFIDMGDQFVALAAGRTQPADQARHFGLVVDDREAVRAALQRAGVSVQPSGAVDFSDPWGNHVQVVDYREIQFTKTPAVLRARGSVDYEKSDEAQGELRERGLADVGSGPPDAWLLKATDDVNSKQLGGTLSATTSLVTITIGGNDAGFSEVIINCAFSDIRICSPRKGSTCNVNFLTASHEKGSTTRVICSTA